MGTCMVMSTVVVALRLFARVVVIRKVDWADCMALLLMMRVISLMTVN